MFDHDFAVLALMAKLSICKPLIQSQFTQRALPVPRVFETRILLYLLKYWRRGRISGLRPLAASRLVLRRLTLLVEPISIGYSSGSNFTL